MIRNRGDDKNMQLRAILATRNLCIWWNYCLFALSALQMLKSHSLFQISPILIVKINT
jgi:hypothetical protein